MRTFLRRCFNWKIALLSAALRGTLFFSMTVAAGWREACGAALLEAVFRAAASGLDGALIEAASGMRPVWTGAVVAGAAIPAGVCSLEYLVHTARGTYNLTASSLVSIGSTVAMSLLTWYTMRQGALLCGGGPSSLAADLRRIGRLMRRTLRAWCSLSGSGGTSPRLRASGSGSVPEPASFADQPE